MPELKVTPRHLEHDAYLYIRQSTPRQVLENTESTQRQYALRDRAVALGWPLERIHVLDCDLGKSGSQSAGRDGFQKLVGEVALGKAGLVMGLEVSRLARNSADWHRLIELCSLAGALILDEDGIYDPANFNDRLLLGLKGTMSEAELHFLKARMRGGMINKARRGELEMRPPVGLVYRDDGVLILDPDAELQAVGFRDLRPDWISHADSETVSRARSPVPAPHWQGGGQRRVALGEGGTFADHPDTTQPSLCWCLRLWSRPNSSFAGRQAQHDEGSASGLAVCDSWHTCWLHHLGAV